MKNELPDPDILITDMNLVGLNLNRVYVDQLEYQRLLRETTRLYWQTPLQSP